MEGKAIITEKKEEQQSQNLSALVDEYRHLLAQKFQNSNQLIIDIKAAQAAFKRMQLESAGYQAEELYRMLRQAKTDAVAYLLMELAEFLGDQQMSKQSKSTRAFMAWGVKLIVQKLKSLGVELPPEDIKELTIDVCLERMEKLKAMQRELQGKLKLARVLVRPRWLF